MKTKNIQKVLLATLAIFSFASCKKESQNIFNMFNDVTVTYNASSPLSVVDYKNVNDGDSVYVDFTINSAKEDMYSYTVERSGGAEPSFFSLSTGRSFSYTNGQANSASIDFGIYRRSDNHPTNPQWIYNLYSIAAPTNPFSIYDVSSWQKRGTLFSAPITSQVNPFLYNAVSGSTIEALAKARTINLTATTATTAATGLANGSAVFFLTPEGKYGMLLFNAVTSDYDKKPFMNVSVKIQR
ncbi:MAG: hypothetical protein EOO90_24100 [Pedobacter sp.]|nr:MAG: hypothetical protein EOO90_24100 [Pedobacter sp.]